jgi:hypothetical protein
MGLDMYLNGNKFMWTDWKEPDNNRTEDGCKIKNIDIELGYWRKHPNLHGYIVTTFAGGHDNCEKIHLDASQMRQIIAAVKDRNLPHTEGFFFGKSYGTQEEAAEDIAIFEKAIVWVETKEQNVSREVIYQASW